MPHEPAGPAGRSSPGDVQLSAMVPSYVRRAVRLRAEQEGMTVRCLLLRLIREAGIVEIDDRECVDRRTTPGRDAPSDFGTEGTSAP